MSHEPTHSEAINTFCDANRILNEIEDWGGGGEQTHKATSSSFYKDKINQTKNGALFPSCNS